MKNFLKELLKSRSDTSAKYFWLYMCIDFSFLLNGIVFCIMSMYPTFLNLKPNGSRLYAGSALIGIWLVFLPLVSREAKDHAIYHLLGATASLVGICVICIYWIQHAAESEFQIRDFPVLLISLFTFTYIIYCISNLIRAFIFLLQKALSKILPSHDSSENGLLYTLEAITSIFVAVSSFIAAFWGIITAIKNFKS